MADAEQADALKFLTGGGTAGKQLRALDWTATNLGEPGSWPQSLRTAVKLMLSTRHPISVFWGPNALHLFNDAAGVFCQGFDVTDRVRAAAELLSAEEHLRLATEAGDIGWWDVEEGNGRLIWPPRVKAMFGISCGVSHHRQRGRPCALGRRKGPWRVR